MKNDKRIKIIKNITVTVFLIIIIALFKIIVLDGEYYISELSNKTTKTILGENAPRGRIYDRNYNLLVDNKSIPVIIYKKQANINIKEEISLAYKISNIIELDFSKLEERNLKEFWIVQNNDLANKKITKEEWIKLKNRRINIDDINNLKIDRITKKDLSMYKEIDKEAAYIYYLMNKGYSYEEKVIKDFNITDKEYAYIAEHSYELNGFDVTYKWERVYLYKDTFRQLLGNISSINYENKEEYLSKGYQLNDLVGSSYLEKQYEYELRGTKSVYKLSNNNLELISYGKRGNDIVLTIDINLQKEVEDILKKDLVRAKKQAATEYYNKTHVVIQEPNTGQILAMSTEQFLYNNDGYRIVESTSDIVTDPLTVGSVVKGASILVGYTNNAIKIGERITDSCIKIYMKPRKCSWSNLGVINDIQALAHSSNIYQFKTAMKVDGFKYSYNKNFVAKESTFKKYRDMYNQFGLGVKTEIDLPVESIGNIGNNTSSDLLLNLVIGQYDTYTTMQLSQYITTIASNGNRYKPYLVKEVYFSSDSEKLGELKEEKKPVILNKVDVDKKYLDRVKDGFKAVLRYGTGTTIMGNISKPAGKTGTSESFLDTDNDNIIDTETVTSTFIGYAPYDNPIMTLTVVSPDLVNPNSNSSTISYANHRITRAISTKFFEIYDNN